MKIPPSPFWLSGFLFSDPALLCSRTCSHSSECSAFGSVFDVPHWKHHHPQIKTAAFFSSFRRFFVDCGFLFLKWHWQTPNDVPHWKHHHPQIKTATFFSSFRRFFVDCGFFLKWRWQTPKKYLSDFRLDSKSSICFSVEAFFSCSSWSWSSSRWTSLYNNHKRRERSNHPLKWNNKIAAQR